MFPSSLSPETCPNPLELVSSFFGVVVVLSPFYGLPLLVGVLLWERSAHKSHPGVNRLVRDASLINLILAPLAFSVTYGIAHALSWSYQAPFWLGIGFCGLWAASLVLFFIDQLRLDPSVQEEHRDMLPGFFRAVWALPLLIVGLLMLSSYRGRRS